MLTGESPLPRPKQQVTVSKWLNGELHIYFNGQELNFKELKSKPVKKGRKTNRPADNHPRRKMNKKLKEDRRRNYLRAALG